jgi:hypothetical protein
MKYAGQVQGALERLDQSLARLYTLIKRGENKAAIDFMKEGELKERYDELQNMITIAGGPGTTGAMGTSQTGRL